MRNYLSGDNWELFVGDCRASMSMCVADNSIDSIVCDPPYELGFMGKSWDNSGIANDIKMWTEALRVLKPGGHLLAFSGSRTYHRMVCAIEDAGFEIRDQIMWVYGSGFPKSLDVSKAIDKAAGVEREVMGTRQHPTLTDKSKINRQGRLPNHGANDFADEWDLTAPATDAAKQWSGWGTALKPAHEPIVVARKPFAGTVAANVLEHGTGAINIDGCRVGDGGDRVSGGASGTSAIWNEDADHTRLERPTGGRWPANVVHDGSDEVLAAFPDAKGQQGDLINHSAVRQSPNGIYSAMPSARDAIARVELDKSAARFFYCAKASKADRHAGVVNTTLIPHGSTLREIENAKLDGNNHPTVKPNTLMRYLCRLVTPPGGTVLDPFTGSGSTGRAALQEGFKFIGCELSDEYAAIAAARIGNALC